ncbi:TrkA family potassium uptake protein [Pseudonocardiaceae bacterium YIM PH 21723]|nr:TrkA family potassium uptake protein [Pseudonocardiaceae bacterium YIM PH 21723]
MITIMLPIVAERLGTKRNRHFIVCGDTPLARRLVSQLVDQMGAQVTVIVPDLTSGHAPEIAALPRVRILKAATLTEEAFRKAGITTASALALVAQDDLGNVHAALRAHDLNPDIRLVIRMFKMNLAQRLRSLFADCAVMSDSDLAAPGFVSAALGESTPNHIRLPGRTLYVATREEVGDRARVVCDITGIDYSDQPRLWPPHHAESKLVLALAETTRLSSVTKQGWLNRWASQIRAVFNRRIGIALFGLFGLLLLSTTLFATVGGHTWADAVYLTLLDAAGAAEPDPKMSDANKLTQVMVTLVGISVIPLITAIVVDSVVTARLNSELGPRRPAYRNHIVLVGLGNLGTRVLGLLHDLGLPVVAIEANPDAPGVAFARRLGVPVLIGNATREETLRQARLDRSRALLALTHDDVTNLQVTLHAQEFNRELRTVLRMFDDDLASRVESAFGIAVSRSVSSLAAPAFAAAMLERRVMGTIAVNRRVLLIAEVPVAEGSALTGVRLTSINAHGEAYVLAKRLPGSQWLDWQPDLEHALLPEDRILIVATRSGLSDILSRSVGNGLAAG